MDNADKLKLRDFLKECLANAGDFQQFSDDNSLFMSGRLDSLSMTRLVVFLEEIFRINFENVDFDVDLIDSMDAIQKFVDMELGRQT